MKIKTLSLLLVILHFSCSPKKEKEEALKKIKPHEKLISFNMNYDVPNIILKSYAESKKFDPKTDTIEYLKDEIYISYLEGVTGCVVYGGDIEIKNDTITLKLIELNNDACTEVVYARVKYRIHNLGNIKYKIKKNYS